MANYYEYSNTDVTDPERVGLGFGDAPDGSERICVSLTGTAINEGLDPNYQWIALSVECARALRDLLVDALPR